MVQNTKQTTLDNAVPVEFLPANVAERSADAARMTDAQWFASGEPFRSMHKNNPVACAPRGW
jgi:hypothetical protein